MKKIIVFAYFIFSFLSVPHFFSQDFPQDFSISEITPEIFEIIYGKSMPEEAVFLKNELRHLTVLHKNFDGETLSGNIIVNACIAEKVLEIFRILYENDYPIEKISLIDNYDAIDEESMTDNNSSAFCYRPISGSSKLSNHALGLAVDINPLYNPYFKIHRDGTISHIQPSLGKFYTDRTKYYPYKIESDDLCVRTFKDAGFEWGGDWESVKDYQHFEWVWK